MQLFEEQEDHLKFFYFKNNIFFYDNMGNMNFRERRLFSLFSSTFFSLLTTMLFLCQCYVSNGEIFTALSHWELLIRVENNFVDLLDGLVEKKSVDVPMEGLEMFLKKVKPMVEEASRRPEQFVSHPVNGFLIIKRFNSNWLEVERILNGTDNELSKSINLHKPLFPKQEDFSGAIEGLFRLQETYKLSAQKIADGELSRQYPNATMETEDCFQVGLMAYHNQDYERAKEWMMEALKKLHPIIYRGYLTQKVLKEYIAWCEYETGNTAEALAITKQLLKEESTTKTFTNPNQRIKKPSNRSHASAKNNVVFFEKVIKNKEDKRKKEEKEIPEYMATYARLCRGETTKTPKELGKLTCYHDHSSPQLVIKPAKIEVLNLEPRIVKYINIITDDEIKQVKKLAGPKLQRATINNLATGQLEFAKYRVSKSAWLEDSENEVISRLSKRIASLTGLATSWSSAEEMQVANYGIGGHYEPHWDHATNEKASILASMQGNRIATFLTYMSDVESGGYTVFINSEAVVKPTKGDAVFWYNLRRSGAGDSTTRHAACPVIVGSKWVSNKWIHAHGQEFRRRCGLEYDGLPGEKVLYIQTTE